MDVLLVAAKKKGRERAVDIYLDGGPELEGVLHLGDLKEGLGIGDAQRAHAVLVAPLLEVPLKRAPAPVALPAADLARELLRKQHSCHALCSLVLATLGVP